jgi:hypothetical protein
MPDETDRTTGMPGDPRHDDPTLSLGGSSDDEPTRSLGPACPSPCPVPPRCRPASAATPSPACSARAAWAPSTRPSRRARAAPSRSRSSAPATSRRTCSAASCSNPRCWDACSTPASRRSTRPAWPRTSGVSPCLSSRWNTSGACRSIRYADANTLGTRQRLELVAKVCDAVYHAHQKGVIHRDLKPGNILVDESGQPKILDFGVARATDSDIQTRPRCRPTSASSSAPCRT